MNGFADALFASRHIPHEFLIVDLELAFRLMDLAQILKDREIARHIQQSARELYDTVLRLFREVPLNQAESESVEEKLKLLKKRLEGVGQEF